MADRKPKRWTARRVSRLVFAVTLLMCIAYPLWMIFSPLPASTMAKETTWITEPLTQGGSRIDYRRAIYELGGEVPEPRAAPPWELLVQPAWYPDSDTSNLPAYTHSLTGLIPENASETDYEGVYQKVMERPFRRAEQPVFAALVERNEPWYQAVLHTEPGPKRVQKRPTMDHVANKIIIAFSLRAMLQFGEGDETGGIESIQLMRKATLRNLQYPVREYMVPYASNERAILTALRAVILSSEQISEPLADFAFDFATEDPNWRKFVLDSFDTFERLHLLWRIQQDYTLRPVWSEARSSWKWRLRNNWAMRRVDIDELLRFQNEVVDQHLAFVDGASMPTLSERCDSCAQDLEKKYPNQGGLTWHSATRNNQTERWKRSIVTRSRHAFSGLTWLLCSVPQQRRLTQLATGIALFKSQHGRFPMDVEELKTSAAGKRVPAAAYTEPFWESPWTYSSSESGHGFVLSLNHGGQLWPQMQWPPPEPSPPDSQQRDL